MKEYNLTPKEQLTLEPYERDHAMILGTYRWFILFDDSLNRKRNYLSQDVLLISFNYTNFFLFSLLFFTDLSN